MSLQNRPTARFRRPFAALAVLVLVTAAAPVHASGSAPIEPWVLAHTAGGHDAEFIVVLRDRADLGPAEALKTRAEKGRFVRDALYTKARASQAGLLEWLEARGLPHQSFYIVNAVLVQGAEADARAIAARPEVDHIEGNPVVHNAIDGADDAAPDVVLAPQAIEPGVTNIRAPEVWATGHTGQGVVVGGADTGVQWDHPALINHYRGWNGAVASHDYNWHDAIHSSAGPCGANSPFPCDDHNHGTHTIGTVCGADAGNINQIGVAPGAKFIACRNMDGGNGTPARYIECMEWCLAPYPVGGTTAQGDPAKAPDVTTNSWGCPASEGCGPATLQAAVEAQRAAGIMFVAAAGNSGPSCSTVSDPPAIYDAAYTVGAYNASTLAIAPFSSAGPVTVDGSNRPKPDITAPGQSVRSSVRGSTYATFSGTSMAAPHVAGAVALLWSAYPNMKNMIPQTEAILNAAAVDVPFSGCSSSGVPNNVWGWGRTDVKAAFDTGPLAVDPVNVSGGGVWLGPGVPNPALRSTQFRFRLDQPADVRLAIYTEAGQRVRTLVHAVFGAGEYVARWHGDAEGGRAVRPGLYFAQLETGGATASRKVIWLGR